MFKLLEFIIFIYCSRSFYILLWCFHLLGSVFSYSFSHHIRYCIIIICHIREHLGSFSFIKHQLKEILPYTYFYVLQLNYLKYLDLKLLKRDFTEQNVDFHSMFMEIKDDLIEKLLMSRWMKVMTFIIVTIILVKYPPHNIATINCSKHT